MPDQKLYHVAECNLIPCCEIFEIRIGIGIVGLTSHSTHYRSFWRRFYWSDDPNNSVTARKDDISEKQETPCCWAQAGLASEDRPEQLVISLEPEAASIFVRRQHLHQLVGQDEIEHLAFQRPRSPRPGRTSVSPEPLQLAPSRPPTEHVAVHSGFTGLLLGLWRTLVADILYTC